MSLILVEKWTWCIEFTKRDLMVWQSWCLDGSMNCVICMGEVGNYIPQRPSGYHCELKVMSRGRCMRFGREKWRCRDNHICTDRRQRCIVTQWAWVTAYSSDAWVCLSGMTPTKHTFDVSSLLGSRFHRLFQELPSMDPLWFSGSKKSSYLPVALWYPTGHFFRLLNLVIFCHPVTSICNAAPNYVIFVGGILFHYW